MDFFLLFILTSLSGLLIFLSVVAIQEIYLNSRTDFAYDYNVLFLESIKDLSRKAPLENLDLLNMEASLISKEWLSLKFMALEDKILLLRAGHSPKEARKALKQFGRESLTTHAYLRTGIQQSNV